MYMWVLFGAVFINGELMNNCRHFWSTGNREDCYSTCDCQRIEKDGGVQCACPFLCLRLS